MDAPTGTGAGAAAASEAAEPFDLLRELFARERLGVLATHAPEHPYASLVAVRASGDLRRLYFCTTRATRKFSFLTADPRVAMLVDSRSAADLDFHQAVAVTAVGSARELEGAERERQLAAFLERHPQLRAFASSPTTALVELAVETYYLVRRFQNVTELHLR
jgi:nitroimidazol reductase NimA-like FMN-containing flavoprotein (pyridoxamine 5'-phosphate oxidase superfamily)